MYSSPKSPTRPSKPLLVTSTKLGPFRTTTYFTKRNIPEKLLLLLLKGPFLTPVLEDNWNLLWNSVLSELNSLLDRGLLLSCSLHTCQGWCELLLLNPVCYSLRDRLFKGPFTPSDATAFVKRFSWGSPNSFSKNFCPKWECLNIPVSLFEP